MSAGFLTAGLVMLAVYWLILRHRFKLMEEDYLAVMTIAFLLFFFGVCGWFLGRQFLRGNVFPLVFLIFMVPLPGVAVSWIVANLQSGSAAVARGFFTMTGTPFLQDGLMFQLPGISIEIAPECSGIHSSLVLFITSLMASYLFLRTPWKRAVFILVVIPLSILRNGFRVYVIGELCVHIGPHMIDSPIHHKGGPLFLALSLIPLFLLLFVLHKSERAGGRSKPNYGKIRTPNLRNRKMSTFTRWVVSFTLLLFLAIAGTGCTAKLKAAYHQKRANQYYAAGQFDQAEIEYKNVLKHAPQNARAWARLGLIYFDEGRIGGARPFLDRALQLDTNNFEVRLKLGTIYLNAGKAKDARDAASFVLDKDPRNAEAPILLAEASASTNEINETRLLLRKMAATGDTAPLEVALGTLSFRQRDLKTAETCFQAAAKLDPKFSDAYSALGNLYLAKQDVKQAEQAFKTAMDLAPSRLDKALLYAQFKILSDDPDAGKSLLQALVKKTPSYLPAWIALAQLAAVQKDYAGGVTLLGNVLSRDSKNLDALLLKARLEMQKGDTAQAIKDLEHMAQNFPNLPVVYYQLAEVQIANNEFDKAASNLNLALKLNPHYDDAMLLLAGIQIHNKNYDSAIASMQQLIHQPSQFFSAGILLARAYIGQDRSDNAIQVYRALEKAYPTNAQIPLLIGTALVKQKKYAEARVEFVQARKLAPDSLPALEQLVDLDLVEKQYDTAQQRVQQLVGQYPKGQNCHCGCFWLRS